MICANSSIRKTNWSQSPYWGSFLKLTMSKIPINSQENDDHTEPYTPKQLFYNFGMKLKSSHLILILDHAPTPTAPSKQIPTFSLNNLLGGKAEGSEAMSGPRFLSWKMSTSRKTHMEPPKMMHWKPFFLKQTFWKFQQSLRGIHRGFPPLLSSPPLQFSKLQDPETATRMPNSGDNMDNLSR